MNTNDGHMDIVHTMRTQQKADVCVLIVNTLNTNGRVPNDAIPASYSSAFFVVRAGAAVTNLSFTHELGHLLGGRHETKVNLGIPATKTSSMDNLPTLVGNSSFNICHGLANDNWIIGPYSGKLKTIMGVYDMQGYDDYQRIPYFENPDIWTTNNKRLGSLVYNNNNVLFGYTIPTIANFAGNYLTVTINGPTTLATNQAGIFNCVAVSDYPTYNYQWEIMKISIPPAVRSAPGDQWVPVGTNSSTYTKPVPNNGDFRDLKLRCIVRDGENYVVISNELYVSYSGQRAQNQQTEEQTDRLFVEENLLPEKTELLDNYPNPFNPSTTINYKLKESSWVSLKVYDIQGREIAVLVNEEKPAGSYSNVFNASSLASGIYIYKLITKDYSESKKMLLVK